MSESRESRRFCPRCGEAVEPPGSDVTAGDGRRERALCDDCYLEAFDLVDAPDRVTVQVCAECGAVRRGGRWVDVGARDYTDVAVEATTEALSVHVDARDVQWAVDPEQVDENTIRMHAYFTGAVRETPIEAEVTVPVYISRGTCDRCGRIAGDDYAAVVQVRAAERTPTDGECDRAVELARERVAERERTGDRGAYVTEVTRTDDGVDLRLSDAQLGRAVATRLVREFGGAVSESETLVTEDGDGNEVYRVTFLARLPPFTPGDVIDLDDGDGPVLVTSAHGNLKGVRLATGDAYEAAFEEGIAPEARRLGAREDGAETTLVAVEDDHAVQVLDPETYEAKTVPRPTYLNPDAETVTVIRHREGLHVLPPADHRRGDDGAADGTDATNDDSAEAADGADGGDERENGNGGENDG